MLIRTFDHDQSRQKAIDTLPKRLSTDVDDHWEWECDCGYTNIEDEAQEDGILECDECGKQFVDMDE